jgi:L-lactate utilization protein LutB
MMERDWYYMTRMKAVKRELERNGMRAYIAGNSAQARKKALALLKKGASVGLGGSRSVAEIGLLADLREGKYDLNDQYVASLSKTESMRRRKQGLAAEYFISGSNAVTEDGKLVNVDGLGNRLAAFCFGPDKVIIIVGRNKIVPDVEAALHRVRNVAAPMNARRLGLNTPCARTGRCGDCQSPQRICSVTLIIEKQKIKDRMHVILVNEDLGF